VGSATFQDAALRALKAAKPAETLSKWSHRAPVARQHLVDLPAAEAFAPDPPAEPADDGRFLDAGSYLYE